jgi:hypothetical protein
VGVRSSTSGISIDSHGRIFTVTGPSLAQLVQVRLRLPTARQVFSTLLAGAGVTLQESDKGRYTPRGKPKGVEISKDGTNGLCLNSFSVSEPGVGTVGYWVHDNITTWWLDQTEDCEGDSSSTCLGNNPGAVRQNRLQRLRGRRQGHLPSVQS